jgi:hypothetical protein
MASDPGGAPHLTTSEVEAARALLRRSDEASRRSGLTMVDRWGDRRPDRAAARALLKAATLAYPWVRSQRVDPALRLARLLCRSPRSVDVRDVEAAYLVSAERIRRVLLHLLALRRDAEGVVSLSFLIGPDGPADLLPLPTGGLLTPALSVPGAADLVPSLVHVASRPGWAWHAAELLQQLVTEGRLDGSQHRQVADGLAPVVSSLVQTCDRATLVADAAAKVDRPDGTARDATRADRFRLRSLVSLFRALPSDVAAPVLHRVLASADARVSAMGLTALLAADRPVASERLDLVARDPEARAELIDGLAEIERLSDLAPRWRSGRSRAEAELVRWLAADTELGTPPDELEHLVTIAAGEHPDDGAVHLFRFRLRSPHWSSARGWMVGAAGPFREDGSVADGFEAFASSVYAAEDEDDLDGHLDAILDALGTWPDADDHR